LRQNRLRRFMAYSSIAQAGYILVALCGAAGIAKGSLVFYLFTYAFANYLVFFLIGAVERGRGAGFEAFWGLAKRHSVLGVLLAIGLFSLAGIPPLAGFMGKFFVFGSAASVGDYLLVAFAALNSVIALYYYIQLLKAAWVDEPEHFTPLLPASALQKVSMGVLTVAVLLGGVVASLNTGIFEVVGK
jgi:NADH-quinone oxidoreductase subunit N